MRRLYLSNTEPGDVIEDVLVISGRQLAQGAAGKPYIKATVSDRSCQMMARMWNASRDIFAAIPESGLLRVRGRIENYQGNLQLIIEQLWPAKEGTYELGDLLPQTNKDVDAMCRRMKELLGSIQNRHLSALVHAYLDDSNLMSNFCKAPAAQSFHHAFIGGLLEHTVNAMEVADVLCPFYPGLNRDLVIAGIFLHDIAKTWELCYDCAFGYTDGGHLVGHIVKSAMWVEHKAKEAEAVLGEPIPQRLIDVLQHIILSHHGLPEHGAARTPATPEAIAVHTIENLDAKLAMALKVTRGDAAANVDGNWTEYMKVFGGRLYRPDVAIDQDDAPMPLKAAPVADDRAANGEPPSLKIALTNPLFEPAAKKR